METVIDLFKEVIKGKSYTCVPDNSWRILHNGKSVAYFNEKKELEHFLKAFKKSGLRATENNISNASDLFEMALSILTYSPCKDLKKLSENRYIVNYHKVIPTEALNKILEYAINDTISTTGYCGEDNEGNRYKSIVYK